MSPADARILQIAANIERDWGGVLRNLDRAMSVDAAASEPNAALVAISLHHAYQAFESLLQRIEAWLSLPTRTGANWHVELLVDAGSAIPGLRPAIFPLSESGNWRDLLSFRHFLRHAYAVALDPGKLRRNVERLQSAVEATGPCIRSLVASLRAG